MALSCLLTAALALLGPSWLSLPVVLVFGATATGWNGVFRAEIMRAVAPAEVGAATSGGLLFISRNRALRDMGRRTGQAIQGFMNR